LRLGTPALTTRGMKEAEMLRIGEWIAAVLADADNESRLARIRKEIGRFASEYPLFAW
jgi:glycine hydroxymethyltransferase